MQSSSSLEINDCSNYCSGVFILGQTEEAKVMLQNQSTAARAVAITVLEFYDVE